WLVTPSRAAVYRRQQARDRVRRRGLHFRPELFVLEDRSQAGVPIEPVSLALTGLSGFLAAQAIASPVDPEQSFTDAFDTNPARHIQLGNAPSPAAAILDDAASSLDELPPTRPSSSGSGATSAEDP